MGTVIEVNVQTGERTEREQDPSEIPAPPSAEEIAAVAKQLRVIAYKEESDPLFFMAQRGEGTMQDWLDKVAEIKARYPEGLNQ